MSSPDSQLLLTLRECRNIASQSQTDISQLNRKIQDVTKLLGSTVTQKLHGNVDGLIEFMFLKTDMEWIVWNVEEFRISGSMALLHLIKAWIPCSAIMSLISILEQLSMGSRQELCLICIEEFFRNGSFIALIIEESLRVDDHDANKNIHRQDLLNALNSLPNKVANSTLGKFSDLFHHELFFQLLSLNTAEAMESLVEGIRNNQAVSSQFLSQIIGTFSSGEKGDAFLGILFPLIIAKSHNDHIWRRLSNIIFSSIQERRLEPVLIQLLKSAPWHECIKWLLGDLIINNRKLKFIMTHKLLLVKCFKEIGVLKNIIGHVAEGCKDLFMEVLEKLFSVWSDASAIKHTSYEQHKYITKAILICLSHMDEAQSKKHRFDLTGWLASGMGHHLDSTDAKLRTLGMIVGECVSDKAAFTDNRLEFGYKKNEESESLIQLLEVGRPPEPGYYAEILDRHHQFEYDIKSKLSHHFAEKNKTFESLSTTKATFLKVISSARSVTKNDDSASTKSAEKEDSELDSDDDHDDLMPYDMSHYSSYKKIKAPSYIRDCIEGLLEQEDRDKMEASISTLTSLIKKNPVAAKESSLELCKILLALDDKFAIENFCNHRLTAMTELAVINPEEVAGYLTHEFYEENYCLQHRIDILDVLTAASRILSSVDKRNHKSANNDVVAQNRLEQCPSSDTWKEVVDRRIEAKTRRFGKVKKKSFPAVPNHFGIVAGYFFYPLLAGYDRRVRTMDLLGNDAMVLGRLLYAVGTIIYSAMNTMAAQSMAKFLLEFTFELRFHTESYVRQAVLFCISMASMSIGKELLGLDIIQELICWMEGLISEDSNDRTRELAIQATLAVKSSLSKELKNSR